MKRVISFAIAIAMLARRHRLRAATRCGRRGAPGLRRQAGHAHVSAGPRTTSRNRPAPRRSPARAPVICASCASKKRSRSRSRRISTSRSRSSSRSRWISWSRVSGTSSSRSSRQPSASAICSSCRRAPSTAAPASTRRPRPTTLRSSQEVPKFGGNYSVAWTNQRVASSDALATRQSAATPPVWSRATCSRILRGFKIDNLRQQLSINLINREISEESARATVIQTLANVRNAYWDLVFAQSAVDVAQRATELADKLVEDNQARVEVGTLAPLDIVQAQAEAATRRQNLAAAEAAAQTAELALEALPRQRHRRSDVAADDSSRGPAVARSRRRPTSRARCAARSPSAPTSSTPARASTPATSTSGTSRTCRCPRWT